MNKIFLRLTIIILVLFFGISIADQVIKHHQSNLLLVSQKRIIEAAKKCVNEEKCDNKKIILLVTLYQNNYLSEEANPITKEIYDKDSYIYYKEGNYYFREVN